MANRERGEMRLQVAPGKTYTLRITTNAICELEDRIGVGFEDLFKRTIVGRRVTDIRWLLWCSLQDYHADICKTPEDAGRIMDEAGGVIGIQDQLVKFLKFNQDPRPKTEQTKGKKGEAPEVEDPTAGPDGRDSTETLEQLA